MEISITPVDKSSEENGKWTDYHGVKLLIARANNTKFRSVFRRLSRPYKREIDKGSISEVDSEELLCTSLAEAILLDWKNLSVKGKNIEYSKSNAKSLLKNDSDCRGFVQDFSSDLDNYLIDEEEELMGEQQAS